MCGSESCCLLLWVSGVLGSFQKLEVFGETEISFIFLLWQERSVPLKCFQTPVKTLCCHFTRVTSERYLFTKVTSPSKPAKNICDHHICPYSVRDNVSLAIDLTPVPFGSVSFQPAAARRRGGRFRLGRARSREDHAFSGGCSKFGLTLWARTYAVDTVNAN